MKKLIVIAGLSLIAATQANVASASSGMCSVGTSGIMTVHKPRKVSKNEVGYIDSVAGKQKTLYTPGTSIFCKGGSRVPLRALRGSMNCKLEVSGTQIGKLVCP